MDHKTAIERMEVLLQGLQESDARNESLRLGPCTCAADAEALETLLAAVGQMPVGGDKVPRVFSSPGAVEKGAAV